MKQPRWRRRRRRRWSKLDKRGRKLAILLTKYNSTLRKEVVVVVADHEELRCNLRLPF